MTKSFAIIVDNKVTDTVVADTLEIALKFQKEQLQTLVGLTTAQHLNH